MVQWEEASRAREEFKVMDYKPVKVMDAYIGYLWRGLDQTTPHPFPARNRKKALADRAQHHFSLGPRLGDAFDPVLVGHRW